MAERSLSFSFLSTLLYDFAALRSRSSLAARPHGSPSSRVESIWWAFQVASVSGIEDGEQGIASDAGEVGCCFMALFRRGWILIVLQEILRRFVPAFHAERAVTFLRVDRVFSASFGFRLALDTEFTGSGIVPRVPCLVLVLVHCVAMSARPSIRAHRIKDGEQDGHPNGDPPCCLVLGLIVG